MITREFLDSTIQNLKDQQASTFAELISELFKDKYVEIYVGDTYETLNTEQVSMDYPAVFFGKVVSSFKDCLIINSVYVDRLTKEYRLGNFMFINDRSIRALSEVDGIGTLGDMFIRSPESLQLKSLVNK